MCCASADNFGRKISVLGSLKLLNYIGAFLQKAHRWGQWGWDRSVPEPQIHYCSRKTKWSVMVAKHWGPLWISNRRDSQENPAFWASLLVKFMVASFFQLKLKKTTWPNSGWIHAWRKRAGTVEDPELANTCRLTRSAKSQKTTVSSTHKTKNNFHFVLLVCSLFTMGSEGIRKQGNRHSVSYSSMPCIQGWEELPRFPQIYITTSLNVQNGTKQGTLHKPSIQNAISFCLLVMFNLFLEIKYPKYWSIGGQVLLPGPPSWKGATLIVVYLCA